jgi:chromosome segregation ATPase
MDSYDKSYLDIDELAKKIEERIKELELQEQEENKKYAKNEEYTDKEVEESIQDLDEIIKQIDARIAEFEREEAAKEKELNLEDLTKKINAKLAKLDDVVEEDLGKTLYDLSEISAAINETIKNLEAKRKAKKAKKAKYCDMARKNANKKCCNKGKKCNKK